MKNLTTSFLSCVVCGLLLAIPAAAAGKAPAAPSKASVAASSARRTIWPPENLSGKILAVNPDHNLVIVKDAEGTNFDVVVTSKTRIRSGGRAIALKDLAQFQNKEVTLRLIPERRGDIAEWIRIEG
ncbi:MAG: hypothetical protein IT159_09550 [Bryobacterales bacterium]|nr:hypothetical protein [Bryobacterales bacterium]